MSFGLALALLLSLSVSQPTASFTDEVVVVASGEVEPLGDVAAAVTVIPREEIEASGAPAAADLLRRVPGVVVLRSGIDTGVTSLFARGAASTQTLVLFDGVRLNSPFFGGYDWGLPLTAGLERIEVVRGPFSALYGGDAIGGVVQLVPRRTADTELSALIEGGGDAWRRAEVAGSLQRGRWSATATAGVREGNGELVNDGFASRVGMIDVGYELNGGRISLLVRRTAGRTEVPFAGASATPRRQTTASELLVAAPVRLAVGRRTEVQVVPSWVGREIGFRDPDDPWGYVASDTDARTGGLLAVIRHRSGGHRLSAGAEWRRDRVSDGSSYGATLTGVEQTTRALFVQDAAPLGAGLSVQAGLRWDGTSEWGSELTPRLTLAWRRAGLRVWTAWGEAFRAPSLGELYYPFSGNLALEPERSRSLEAGAAVPFASGATLQLVGFRNRTRHLIQYEPATLSFANVARALQDGAELSLSLPVAAASRVSLAATWLDARDGDGAALLRRPEWSGALAWRGPLGDSVDGEVVLTWVGARDDLDPVTLARVAAGGSVTAAASVRAALTPALALRVRGENLANRHYEEVRGFPAPGRRLFVALETVVH